MGIYLNPGIKLLERAKRAEHYVDKSMLIATLNKRIDTNDFLICSSRPRRFGKTMAANMIAAYYSKGCDSHEVFSNLKISKDPSFEENINKYNVIKIDMNGIVSSKGGMSVVEYLSSEVIYELKETFPNINLPDDISLATAIKRIYAKTGEKFIFIMDEYDVIIRDENYTQELKEYLELLVSLFKSEDVNAAIALAYLTGIMPIIREKTQSKLNNFKEYTMLDAEDMAPFMGFTVDEVKALADKNNMDFEEIKRWYDGYNLNGVELYSPKSVITAIEKKRCSDYWTQTGSYEAVSDYIELNLNGIKDDVIKMMAGENIEVDVSGFNNNLKSFKTKEDVFIYLIHLGYLAYDVDRKTCRIPNSEIKNQWANALKRSAKFSNVASIIDVSKKLLEATYNLEGEVVAKSLEKSHELLTSNLSYNNEQSMQSAIMLSYFYAYDYYTILPEVTTGKGYADIVMVPFVPNIPALVIELKKDKVVGGAIEQIKEKDYPSRLSGYVGNTLLVGISYDSKTKKHSCIIERA
ncbi:AAA family ATPase [Bullifex porci]|uniref:AAA family ATPase n=1 Tax=Bullifex porci TaxID=2606638 RepID=UPI0023F055B8|nr:AAA family ATPase [Bullifex porci]MDD7255604.1 AAA family ATPase [Bullifex porci]MDY2740394.1 AAA family ATPase [Bullifex porci]